MNTSVEKFLTYFVPEHYEVKFDFSRAYEDSTFEGEVTITGDKIHAEHIKLHVGSDLSIESVLINNDAADYKCAGDTLTIQSSTRGTTSVRITFQGQITDAMHGIYPCYFKHDGEEKRLFATQFESHHAREAFPCVDEPAAKATFDVALKTPTNLKALSNMPVKHVNNDLGHNEFTYERTPRMSTYLLAFVIGEIHKVSATTSSGVEVSIYATPVHQASHLEFALDSAVKSLEFFEAYFDTPYPLPKCDHVALPDFSSGAMENWGLITYRESCLIASSDAAVSTKEFIAMVIAHETSHQWFGNLVTMKWWDELWLNESFANMMEYVAVDAIYPEWNIWNQFVNQEAVAALRRDQLKGVQAVQCPVNHPDEISTLFDPAIVYAKGSRLIKMLWQYVGDDAWRRGLGEYFKTHSYSNTTGDDLWLALSNTSGKNVAEFMHTWLHEPGYPVVTISHGNNGSYQLSQKRFVLGDSEENTIIWHIPLASKTDETIILSTKENSVSPEKLMLPLNTNDKGHYIVDYDDTSMESLILLLDQGELSTVDRFSLLHEQSLLAKSLRVSTGSLVSLLDHYRNETEEIVWNAIAGIISDLKRFVEDDESTEASLKNRVIKLTLPLYNQLGIKEKAEDTESTLKLRAVILSLLSYAEHTSYLEASLEYYRETSTPAELPAEIRPVILSAVSRFGTNEEFESLLSLYDKTNDPELKDDLASAICQAKDEKHIQILLERMTDKSFVRPQDVTRWFVGLLRNKYAREKTWHWLETHWEWVLKTYKGDKSYDNFARYPATILSDNQWLDRYRNFFGPKQEDPALTRTIKIGLTELETRTKWVESQKQTVIDALSL